MIPDPRRDARTEPSVDDRGSGSVLGFEGDGRAAEPERRVVSRAESDRMLIGVRPVVPLNPEGDRPLAAHRDASGDIVVHSIELPRPTNFPDDVRRAGDRPIMSVPAKVFHFPVRGESLHVVGQDRTLRWRRRRCESSDLRCRQGAVVDEDLVDDPVEEVVRLTAGSPDLDAARADRRTRTGDGTRLDAIEVAFHGRPIKRRREMIPDPRRDARTEPSVDDRGSGSVLDRKSTRLNASHRTSSYAGSGSK